MMDCDCRIANAQDGTIAFCAMHKAAPELLKVLNQVVAYGEEIWRLTKLREEALKGITRVMAARFAIAKAASRMQ